VTLSASVVISFSFSVDWKLSLQEDFLSWEQVVTDNGGCGPPVLFLVRHVTNDTDELMHCPGGAARFSHTANVLVHVHGHLGINSR
jgi:hypothetical protein